MAYWTGTIALAAAVAILCAGGQAHALDPQGATENTSFSGQIIGNCYASVGIPFWFPFSGAQITAFPYVPGGGGPSGTGMMAGGSYFNASGGISGGGGDARPPQQFLEEVCGLTGIQNLVEDGPNAPMSGDSFVGWTFRATDPSDNNVYDYVVGLQGATNTQQIISKTPAPSDTTAPTVVLSGGPSVLTGTDPFTVTATFAEDVSGFDDLLNDVTVANGSVTAITGGPSVYALTISPTGAGDVSVTVPAAAAQDLAGNDNEASNTLVIGNDIVEITKERIAGFMLGRANNLAANQPLLTRFLMDGRCGSLVASGQDHAGTLNLCASGSNVWVEITRSWSNGAAYTLGTIGAHRLLSSNLLAGAMLQFDHADDGDNDASGQGWMAGPYFVAKAPEQPLYLEGRLLYGETENDIAPLGTYTDRFFTTRWLAQFRVTGEYETDAVMLMPLLDVTYAHDSRKTYTDSLGNTIVGQSVSLTQVTAGLDFSTPIEVAKGSLRLVGGISGIHAASDGATKTPASENWRGRTHVGLDYGFDNGAMLNLGTFYDGLGSAYESYGGTIALRGRF